MAEINEQTFQMLVERFDRVDKDNDDIKKSIAAHVQDDKEFHDSMSETVSKHGIYWSLFLWISGATVLGAVAAFARGLFK